MDRRKNSYCTKICSMLDENTKLSISCIDSFQVHSLSCQSIYNERRSRLVSVGATFVNLNNSVISEQY